MGLTETSLALAGCALVLGVAIILDRRPYRPGKLNYIPLMHRWCRNWCSLLKRITPTGRASQETERRS